METRKIKKVIRSKPTIEGAGVHLRRAFGNSEVPLFDPFLMLDAFRAESPNQFIAGFPWHPHRGIETITYMLRGDVEHGDSLGHSGIITSGDVQWMTAGSGIIHQEMPKGDNQGKMGGFQLWANLPASRKMMDPKYRDVTSAMIPEVTLEGGAKVKIICGSAGGVSGPVHDIVIEPEYLDVSLPPKAVFTHPTHRGHTVFVYVIDGRGFFCQEKEPFSFEVEGENYFDMNQKPFIENRTVVLFEDGDRIMVSTEEEPVRFLYFSGKPIGESVAWYGPIVMNTREELRIAFEEYRNGTFLKHRNKQSA